MITKTNSIKFETYINDTEENCWKIECHLSGSRPVYEDMMTRSGWYVEDFTIADILIECDSGPNAGMIRCFKSFDDLNLNDAFMKRDLNEFRDLALEFFVDDWIDCQNKASDVCAYDLTN